jgi:hypothetical protein
VAIDVTNGEEVDAVLEAVKDVSEGIVLEEGCSGSVDEELAALFDEEY